MCEIVIEANFTNTAVTVSFGGFRYKYFLFLFDHFLNFSVVNDLICLIILFIFILLNRQNERRSIVFVVLVVDWNKVERVGQKS